MFRRRISERDVWCVVERHEVVAEYPHDTPFPSRLLLGCAQNRPLHVVLAYNDAEQTGIVVTVYEPDAALWNPDFKTRKKP